MRVWIVRPSVSPRVPDCYHGMRPPTSTAMSSSESEGLHNTDVLLRARTRSNARRGTPRVPRHVPRVQGHKKAVPAAPKPGDRALMTPQQKKVRSQTPWAQGSRARLNVHTDHRHRAIRPQDADSKAMQLKAAAKAGAPAAAPAKK